MTTEHPRICVVGSGPRFLSGISYYTHRLATALAGQFPVSVILMRQLLPTRFYPGAARVGKPLHEFRYPTSIPIYDGVDWTWWRTILGALAFLRRERPDVVVMQWWTGTVLHTYLLLGLVAKVRHIKVIVEFHEVQDVGELDVPFAGTYVNTFFPLLLRLADAYVVHSEFDRAALQERYGLRDRPVAVVPHGPYTERLDAATELPNPGCSRAEGPVRLLYFGVIRPFKGVEDLVRAFDALDDAEIASFTLTIVGETWEGHTLPAQLVAMSPRRNRIDFVNRYVSGVEADAYFATADAVVLPYHRSSASGPLHTAMARGLPVVVTSVGGLIEAAGEYAGAIFVPPHDPESLKRALRALLGRRNQRYADPHSWAATVDSYAHLIAAMSDATPRSALQRLGHLRRPHIQRVTEPPEESVKPVLLADVELSQTLSGLTGTGRHERAVVLARLHERPLGLVDVALPIGPNALAEEIDASLGEEIARHLHLDGLTQMTPDAPCGRERERFVQNESPSLTLIIPTRERAERLSACLDSIWQSAYPSDRFEVIVVDNDPATVTTQLVVERHAREHNCRYIREDARGSASARNAGVTAASHELLVFTDDDVRVDRHWLTEIARAFTRFPHAHIVSGLLLPLELETPAQVWFEQYGGFSRGFVPKVFDLKRNRPTDNRLYPFTAGVFGTGNNMAFRRDALLSIGGFDPALGNGTPALGGVDSEVLLRAVLRGHTVVYEPGALVFHQHRRDYAGLRQQVYAYGVGLTAYMTKVLIDNPRHVPALLRRVPGGLQFLFSTTSRKNASKNTDYPKELSRLELRGMLHGPFAYVRSRRAYGPHVTRPCHR